MSHYVSSSVTSNFCTKIYIRYIVLYGFHVVYLTTVQVLNVAVILCFAVRRWASLKAYNMMNRQNNKCWVLWLQITISMFLFDDKKDASL